MAQYCDFGYMQSPLVEANLYSVGIVMGDQAICKRAQLFSIAFSINGLETHGFILSTAKSSLLATI